MLRFKLHEGNTRALPFLLYLRGEKDEWNVDAATQIRLEWSKNGVDQAPIVADKAHPDADWPNGRVIIAVAPTDVTSSPGTYYGSLTLDIDGESITAEDVTFEVLDRHGYTP